jgi:type IV pilus assembly protein PilM
MFSRKSIGVSFSSTGVAFAQLRGPASAPRLERVSQRSFPTDVLRFSLREKNILDTAIFSETVREAHNSLLSRSGRVFITLPDTVGRVMLLDVEERFKSRSEALDILRWKLKKKVPFDISEAHLDFQQLATSDNGGTVILVVMVARAVIEQYEEALNSAGIVPVGIDLDCFNLYRVFENRLVAFDDFALVSRFASSLGIMFFSGGRPEFIRIRDFLGMHALDATVHNEIKCSMLAYRDRFKEREVRNVFYIAPPQVAKDFREIVRDAMGCEPVLLETRSTIFAEENIPSDQESLYPFSTAIGAALRDL